MRKIGTILGITALAAVSLSPSPLAAFGIHLGPFYFHVPFVGHHHRHRLQMRANEARTKPNDVSRSAAKSEQVDREARFDPYSQAHGRYPGGSPGPPNAPTEQNRKTQYTAS